MADSERQLRLVPDGSAVTVREPLWRQVLGAQLRRLRHDRGETLAETARRAGISTQYLSEIERGVKEPSSEMIAAVVGALGASLVEVTLSIAQNLQAVRDLQAARELRVAQRGLRTVRSTGMARPGAAHGPTCMASYAMAA